MKNAIIVIIISLVFLCGGGVLYSSINYQFYAERNSDYDVEFYLHYQNAGTYLDHYINASGLWIYNETIIESTVVIDDCKEYTVFFDIYRVHTYAIVPHKVIKTKLKYGWHDIDVYYFNKTVSISEQVEITETTYVMISLLTQNKLYLSTSHEEPVYL
jgi:hypothetical protein